MKKSPKEITDAILSSLSRKNDPLAILIEAYLGVIIKNIKAEAVKEYIASQNNLKNTEYKPGY